MGLVTEEAKERNRTKQRERMAAFRLTPAYQVWLDNSRENRKRLKEKYRREAGKRLRSEIQEEAKKKREASTSVKGPKLHDAHVKCHARVVYSRKRSAEKYERNPDYERERVSNYKKKLPDAYVIQNLKAAGFPVETISPNVINLKREAMLFRRLSLQAKTILKTLWKEQNETINQHT